MGALMRMRQGFFARRKTVLGIEGKMSVFTTRTAKYPFSGFIFFATFSVDRCFEGRFYRLCGRSIETEKGGGNMRSIKPVTTAKTGYIAMSTALCVLGMAMMLFPAKMAPLIAVMLGICMILFGMVKLVGYFSKDLFRLTFQYDLAYGILLIAMGIILLVKTGGNLLVSISIIHGVYVLSDSLLKVQIAIDAKHFGIRLWWLILAAAILAGTLGFMLVLRPFEGAWLLVMLSGATLLAEGILNLITVLLTVRIIRHQLPD